MKKRFDYLFEGQIYKVEVIYKRSRTISYHFRNNAFLIYAPYFVSYNIILNGLNKFSNKLIKEDPRTLGKGKDFIYILGKKINIQNSGTITFSNGTMITYKNMDDLDKKLRSVFLDIVKQRTRYYETVMNISTPNKVRVRNMFTRYGSNSLNNHSITYSLILLHYDIKIIDAIVVHELAHCFVRGHDKTFYDVIYKYCPDYKKLHFSLKKGIFSND